MKFIVILALVAVCAANPDPDHHHFNPFKFGGNVARGGIKFAGNILCGFFGCDHGHSSGGGGAAKGGASASITIVITLIQKLQTALKSGNITLVISIVQELLPKV